MITIYTRSEPKCAWCDRIKELLKVYGFDYYEKDISIEAFKREFLEKGFRTVPQVFVEDHHVGGYETTKDYIRGRFFENFHPDKKAIILEELEKIV